MGLILVEGTRSFLLCHAAPGREGVMGRSRIGLGVALSSIRGENYCPEVSMPRSVKDAEIAVPSTSVSGSVSSVAGRIVRRE